ncbi:MAG: sigma-70 family RNA polymerase sigma factor [Thermoanaerobaculia bacterium]|nr:sigma-70 family RNA polymerase sigma factor [Thermoanaerobaculia bacterium]
MADQKEPKPGPGASPGEVTALLLAWSAGDKEALQKLIPLVYSDLRKRAEGYLRKERSGHTLQPTALVNEAYLKLVDQKSVRWQNRAHFHAVAARAMREVLVDYARRRQAEKRGGAQTRISLDEAGPMAMPRSLDLLSLDMALARLATLDERQSKLVELRVFGGLTIDEAAHAMGISAATVSREWRHAEAWLHREMAGLTP